MAALVRRFVRYARYRSARDDRTYAGVIDGDDVLPLATGSPREEQDALVEAAMAGGGYRTTGDPEPLAAVSLLSPVPEPPAVRDFYAFEQHVATARRTRGLDMEPDWYELPVFYFTNPGAVLGPDDLVRPPAGTDELDYELEVAAVIGRTCRDVEPAAWRDVVAGFTIMNDWSARDLQRREMKLGLGPAKGKDFATSLGPVLVTPDELVGADDVPRAAMVARVDGDEWSRGELADLHHGWGALIAHASRDATLRPGDVIGSGTVGTGCILELGLVHGHERFPWLRPGAVVELEVDGIGVLRNEVG